MFKLYNIFINIASDYTYFYFTYIILGEFIMMKIKLSEIAPSDKVIVYKNNINSDSKRYLESLGIRSGNEIVCLYYAMFDDPIAFLVDNSIIAIRKSDCDNIIVLKDDGDGSF